jgi:hypothetical protein
MEHANVFSSALKATIAGLVDDEAIRPWLAATGSLLALVCFLKDVA